MKIFSFSPFGYEGALVEVEVDLRRGIPAVDVVGLADGAVKESRERMRSAIRNSGFDFPLERVLISLSPADLKKEGAGFDLALALAVLDAKNSGGAGETDGVPDEVSPDGQAETKIEGAASPDSDNILVMGELELSGALRPVRGIHAAASTAVAAGITRCIVASANGDEAREVSGMKVFAAENLADAFDALYKSELFTAAESCSGGGADSVEFDEITPDMDFKFVKGQKKLVRALQIAAAGGHNVLAFGPPGCGKTLSMQKFPSLLPLLTVEESQSVTRIHSLAGLLPPSNPRMKKGDFRMPHQTASIEGMCGGGINCRPGEISLAHNGVLFLDEAAEFRSSVLQMLRVPLEGGSITLSRAGRSTVFPARFQLLMATNPCPCGNYGVPGRLCLCSAKSVEMYWKKFSGPLLDRIDLRVGVGMDEEKASDKAEENQEPLGISTEELRKQIAAAVASQRRRGKKNGQLTPREIVDICKLGPAEQKFLEKESARLDFSQRAVSAVLKVARTIADMEEKESIELPHLKEAVEYRKDIGPLACME